MNKLTFNDLKKVKTKDYTWTVQIFYNLQNHPTFHSEERLVNLARGRGGLCYSIYILLVYAVNPLQCTALHSTQCSHLPLYCCSDWFGKDYLKQFSFCRRTSALWGSIPARRPPPCSRPRGRPTATRTSRANAHPAPSPAATSEPAQPPAPRCSSCCAKRSRIGSS